VIQADFIAEWRAHTRWATDEQVEQDLVLSRALVAIFEDPEIPGALALRGGTALHKLHFAPPRRAKLRLPAFTDDMAILLPPGTTFDVAASAARVASELIDRLPGDPWKGRGTKRRSR